MSMLRLQEQIHPPSKRKKANRSERTVGLFLLLLPQCLCHSRRRGIDRLCVCSGRSQRVLEPISGLPRNPADETAVAPCPRLRLCLAGRQPSLGACCLPRARLPLPTCGAACTSFPSPKRPPQTPLRRVQTRQEALARNTLGAQLPPPGTTTSTSGSCPCFSSFLYPNPVSYNASSSTALLLFSNSPQTLDARPWSKGPVQPAAPVPFDTPRTPKAMVHKIHF